MKTFDGLGLSRTLTQSLEYMKYTTPTPIQAKAIPLALTGRDIMGSASTGTGKTAAFAIPLVQHLLNTERDTALVMTPTRELGKQVMDIMQQLLGPKPRVKTAFLIGGEPMGKQYAQLRNRPRLIVGTPGRINDHMERGNVSFDQTTFLVLDETDRMLDMGFSIQIDKITKHIPKQRQTLMFSATMPKNIMKMADKYLNNPERIEVGQTNNPAKNIDQKVVRVSTEEKYGELTRELGEREGSIIVFVKTKRNADRIARKLVDQNFDADAIHGDLKQSKRDRVIKAYRGEKFRILVATDVVARGLDVPHVAHVINYDLPQMPEDYIHRIGRTARAGAKGEALCLVTPQDLEKWSAIQRLIDPKSKSNDDDYGARKSKGRGGYKGKSSGGYKGRSGGGYKGKSDNRSEGGYKGKSDGYRGKPRRDRDGNREDRQERSDRQDRPERSFEGQRKRTADWKERNNERNENGKPKHRKGPSKPRSFGDKDGNRPARQDRDDRSGNRQDRRDRHFSNENGDQPRRRPRHDTDGNSFEPRKDSNGNRSEGRRGDSGQKRFDKPKTHNKNRKGRPGDKPFSQKGNKGRSGGSRGRRSVA